MYILVESPSKMQLVSVSDLKEKDNWLIHPGTKNALVKALQNSVRYLENAFPSKWSACIPEKPTYSMENGVPINVRVFLTTRGLCSILLKKLFTTSNQKIVFKDARRLGTIALSRTHSLHFSLFPNQLCNQLIWQIKTLYENDNLDNETLMEPFKKILQDFFQREDIARINIFAILNSLRKQGYGFWYDSKYWTVCFSDRAYLRLGKSNVRITVDSSIFFDIFRLIMNQLEPIQQDLLSLMYMTILRDPNHRVLPRIQNFELTIERNYKFWCHSIRWETEREYFLGNCESAFIRQPFFSKKDSKYYCTHTSLKSFRDFFRNSHIFYHDEFKAKISGLSFEPI